VTALADAIDRLIEVNTALRQSRALSKPEQRLERAMRRAFLAQRRLFLTRFARLERSFPPELREAAESDWLPLFDQAALETVQVFQKPLSEFTARALESAMIGAIADLGIDDAFDLTHPLAVDFMAKHGADRVTAINSTTRDYLRTILTQAAEEGWSYDKTARAIRTRYADFSVKRARNIAVYELGDAYVEGTMVVARDLQGAGLEMQKKWISASDSKVRTDHRANDAEGWIPLDDVFQSGHDRPPTDSGCRCSLGTRRKPDA
jgi:uncharacterized protein with gpF-like domain